MSFFGYSPASSTSFNNGSSSQILGSPNSSGGGMSGSASPTGVTASPTTTPCCEGGRPLVTDPLTGASVCSCQYDPTRLSLSSYPRLTAYPGSPYAPPTEQNPYPTLDSSAFYSPLGGAYAGLKEGSGTGDVSCWPNPGSLQSSYYSYDPAFAYGYGGGYDLAARRKNATRESTATLKAWLSEHKKNPYPTKGEKIMLAIITKMTLTQVSTWFANARRRLKKENKMTWEPKNKTDDDDDDMKDDDDDCDSSGHGGGSNSPGLLSPTNHINNNSIHHGLMKSELSSSDLKSDSNQKPKIWSLADTAACKTPPPLNNLHSNLGHPHHFSSLGDNRSSNQLSGYSSSLGGMGGNSTGNGFNGPTSSPPGHHPGNNSNLNHHHLNAALNAHHQHQQFVAHQQLLHHHPAPVTSSWSFALPTYGRPYGSFLTTMSGSNPAGSVNNNGNSPSLQTETPPLTPPNLKVPVLPSSLSQFAQQHPANNSSNPYHNHHQNIGPTTASGGGGQQQSSTAFKPVLKSSSGGFCV